MVMWYVPRVDCRYVIFLLSEKLPTECLLGFLLTDSCVCTVSWELKVPGCTGHKFGWALEMNIWRNKISQIHWTKANSRTIFDDTKLVRQRCAAFWIFSTLGSKKWKRFSYSVEIRARDAVRLRPPPNYSPQLTLFATNGSNKNNGRTKTKEHGEWEQNPTIRSEIMGNGKKQKKEEAERSHLHIFVCSASLELYILNVIDFAKSAGGPCTQIVSHIEFVTIHLLSIHMM